MDFEDSVYINSLDCSFVLNKARFFLGDRWITIGELATTGKQELLVVHLPDIEEFLEKREHLDDGTFDWLEWGPRVN